MYVCHDVNVHVGMSWWDVMMQMYPCRYAMNVNAPLWVYHDTNALMQTQFIQKFFLFSKRGFHNAWNHNILKTWLIIHEKSSSFWLKAPKKNWWSLLENLWMRHLLEIWWSGPKDLSLQIDWAKRMAHFQGLFGKMNSLEIKHLEKIHFCCSWIWQFDKRQAPPW